MIATYHKYTVLGTDDTTQLDTAALWWKTNYNTLAASGPFIINLMNEWGSHNQTPATYATAYNQAIAIVRQTYQGPIILDCAGYGQETSVAANAVKGTGGVKLSDTNIILSAHIYPNGYNQALNHTFQQSDLDSNIPGRQGLYRWRIRQLPLGPCGLDGHGQLCENEALGCSGLGLEWGRRDHEYGHPRVGFGADCHFL